MILQRVCNPVTLATASVCASSHSLEPRDVGVLQSQLMLLLSSGMSSDLYFHVQDLKKLQKKRWLQVCFCRSPEVYLLDLSINRKGPQPHFYVPLQLHYYFPHFGDAGIKPTGLQLLPPLCCTPGLLQQLFVSLYKMKSSFLALAGLELLSLSSSCHTPACLVDGTLGIDHQLWLIPYFLHENVLVYLNEKVEL